MIGKQTMICYRDRAFCYSPNCKNKCGRQLTSEIKDDANKWWTEFTKGREVDKAPICVGYFCDENGEVIK